jgi:hypothetical protein
MSTPTFRAERARYASLTRSRLADDPELVAARLRMQEHGLLDFINRALEKAPPMTGQLRERIIELLPLPLCEDVVA